LHKSAGGTALLGRSPEAEVSFLASQARTVSRRHALLWLATDSVDAWFVVDLGSTTGTFLNRERVQACRLSHGDLLSLGASGPVLRVELLLDREVPIGSSPADRIGQLERWRAEDVASSSRP
jgi:pSer/pThr/pTyr-binding forkhead associated (FHA) protein